MSAQPKIEYKERRKANIPVALDRRVNNRQPTHFTIAEEKNFINRLGTWYKRSRFSQYARRDTLLLNYCKSLIKREDIDDDVKSELYAHAMKQYRKEYGEVKQS